MSLKIQRGNQNPYIEEELTTQWPKEKVQKDKQRSTKHTHKTKDRVTRKNARVNSGASEGWAVPTTTCIKITVAQTNTACLHNYKDCWM